MIEVSGISVKKGQKTIVNGVSFKIRPGRITVVLGMNGAGKSTLLDAVSGHTGIDGGRIDWDGRPLDSLTLKDLACRRAVLSQQVQIAFQIPVNDLVEMGSYVVGNHLRPGARQLVIDRALQETGMSGFKNRNFNSLSGGEQKRILLAKCLVQLYACQDPGNHKYLFLDEPTANLDIHHQFRLAGLVKEIAGRQNIGVFTVLHDINLAAQFADEIILMKAGVILGSGSPESILTRANLMDTLEINSIIHKHPINGRPQITALPI